MNVVVTGRVNVDGVWWDVSVDHYIEPGHSGGKINEVTKFIRGLSAAGIISRVAVNGTPNPGSSPPQATQTPVTPPLEQATFSWPAPHCDLHREPLKVSKTQKTEGKVQYYCPKRFDEGYCKKRASVDARTGIPKFWEVN